MSNKQVVLITGASTGFGRLFTETLSRKGHTVFATMRDPNGKNAKNVAEIKALAQKENLPIHILELDVTDEASVNRAVDAAVKQAGRLDVVINNAGYPVVGLEETVTPDQAAALMNTNYLGPVRVNRAVIPHFHRQHSGLLMYISSGAGRITFPSFGHYSASKFALEALAEAYSYELAGQGIESVIVQPGAYQTAIFGNIVVGSDTSRTSTYGEAATIPDKINAGLAASAGNPQEVADAVLKIVETPVGERKLRYRVSTAAGLEGVDQINDLCAKIQAGLLDGYGLSSVTKFVKGKSASA
jgi:NAD(P)-dependent dehydrogenase (short-subunit alcohol dehydrogenase family)